MAEDLMARELPAELALLVDSELENGERIAWTGQPRLRPFPLGSIPLVLFGLPWTAFSVFWMWAASGGMTRHAATAEAVQTTPMDVMSMVFPWFGLPFVLIGVALLTSPLWMHVAARRTAYVITDRRAFILKRGRTVGVRSFTASDLRGVERTQYADGSGNVVLQAPLIATGSDRLPVVAFLGVPDVKHVEELLRNLPKR